MNRTSMHEAYRGLLSSTLRHGVTETNARTGAKIKLVPGGTAFTLDLTTERLPLAGNRAYFPHVAAAEVAWQLLGTQDPTFILRHAPKLWSKFLEEEQDDDRDGFPRMILKTAYGYRWRDHFGRDQLRRCVDQLKGNPTNRQLVVMAWDPATDGCGGSQPKNVPCPLGFAVNRFGDDLHMSVFVRSSDIFVGLPYDVMAYALTLDAIAASVGCRPGSLHFSLAHAHLYETHWLAAKACTEGLSSADGFDLDRAGTKADYAKASATWMPPASVEPNLPGWTIEAIEQDPDGYVAQVKLLARRKGRSAWNPMPEVVE